MPKGSAKAVPRSSPTADAARTAVVAMFLLSGVYPEATHSEPKQMPTFKKEEVQIRYNRDIICTYINGTIPHTGISSKCDPDLETADAVFQMLFLDAQWTDLDVQTCF